MKSPIDFKYVKTKLLHTAPPLFKTMLQECKVMPRGDIDKNGKFSIQKWL